MDDVLSRYWHGPVKLGVEPRAIHPAEKPAPLGRAAPRADESVLRAFVNDRMNSRLARRLGGPARFVAAWKAEIPSLRVSAVLWARDRVALSGFVGWRLFDRDGKPIGGGLPGPSDLSLDPERSVFYVADRAGLLAVRRLRDGEVASHLSFYGAENYKRNFVARRGARLVTLSIETQPNPDQPPPERSMLEVTNLRDPAMERSYDEKDGPVVMADLTRESTLLLIALHDDSIVLATENRVYVVDLATEIKQVLTGSFRPVALSLDETGRIYMVVRSEDQLFLWSLTQAGERLYSFTLPPGVRPGHPPVIGYDHTVYLASGTSILAVAQDGKLSWSRTTKAYIGGATVTADDQLLVSEGGEIAAYNASGERRVVANIPDAAATPPVLTDRGELLVASSDTLFCLRPE